MESNLDRQIHASDYGQEMKEKQVIEAKVQQEQKFLGSIRHVPGFTLYEIVTKTMEVREAKFMSDSRTVDFTDQAVSGNKVLVDPACFYLEALNKKQALWKYLRLCNIKRAEEQFAFVSSIGMNPKNVLPKEIYQKAKKRLREQKK